MVPEPKETERPRQTILYPKYEWSAKTGLIIRAEHLEELVNAVKKAQEYPELQSVAAAFKKEKVRIDGKTCPGCGSKVYDNRQKKVNGEYKPTAPDFACSNAECKGGKGQKKWAVWPGQYEIGDGTVASGGQG